jgi:hypothetical protein
MAGLMGRRVELVFIRDTKLTIFRKLKKLPDFAAGKFYNNNKRIKTI